MIEAIAQQLVDGCRAGEAKANLDKLYAPDAVSVEARDNGNGREAQGLTAIRGKHEWFEGAIEVESQTISGPFLHDAERFAVIFEMSGKDRDSGARFDVHEVALYTVRDGKIVREEFFYS